MEIGICRKRQRNIGKNEKKTPSLEKPSQTSNLLTPLDNFSRFLEQQEVRKKSTKETPQYTILPLRKYRP